MGLLDSLLGAVAGGGSTGGAQSGQAAMINAVIGMLGNDAAGGGLGGLLAKFKQGGLGHVADSWVSSGQNMPVSADQLGSVLGNDTIANIAKQVGLSHGDAAGQLSQMLPQIIDKLTPHGQVPQGGLGSVADLLGSLMRR